MSAIRTSVGSDTSMRRDSFKGCDVIKKGYLHIKRPPGNSKIRLKAWQKKFFVLRDGSFDDGITRLDMYSSEQCWEQNRKKDKYEVPLQTVTHVEEYTTSEKYPSSLTVNRKGHSPLVFAAQSDSEMKEWFVVFKVLAEKYRHEQASDIRRPSCPSSINCEIQKLSPPVRGSPTPEHVAVIGHAQQSQAAGTPSTPVLARSTPDEVLANMSPKMTPNTPFIDTGGKGYPVVMEPCPDAVKNHLKGEYTMRVIGSDVVLQRGTDVICWDVLHIKKFKSERLKMPGVFLLTLEAGLQAGPVSGTFLFRTAYGKEIVTEVRDAAKKICLKHTSEKQEHKMEKLKVMSAFNAKQRTLSEPCLNIRVAPHPRHETSDPASYTLVSRMATHVESNSYLQLFESQGGSIDEETMEEQVATVTSSRSVEVLALPDRPRKDSGFSELLEDKLAGKAIAGPSTGRAGTDSPPQPPSPETPTPPAPGTPAVVPVAAETVGSAASAPVPAPPPRPRYTLTQNSVLRSSDDEEDVRRQEDLSDRESTPPKLPPRRGSSQTSTPRGSPPNRRSGESIPGMYRNGTPPRVDEEAPPPPPRPTRRSQK